MPTRPMTAAHWALLLLTAASFASSVVLNKLLVGELPPLTRAIVSLRRATDLRRELVIRPSGDVADQA